MDGSTMDMTRGKPWRLITAFAIPVLLSQVFQQLYNTADALIVGRFLGDEALKPGKHLHADDHRPDRGTSDPAGDGQDHEI